MNNHWKALLWINGKFFFSTLNVFWGAGGLLINKVRKTSSVYLKYMNISRFLPLGGAKMLQNHWKRCHWLLTQSKAQSPTAHDLSEPREKWLWHRLMTHVGYTSECIKTDTRDKSRIKESHPLGEYAECQSHMGNLSEGVFSCRSFLVMWRTPCGQEQHSVLQIKKPTSEHDRWAQGTRRRAISKLTFPVVMSPQ